MELKYPTLAAIIGQMRKDISSHLIQIESILADTWETCDAGVEYFRYIGDLNLMEFMSGTIFKGENGEFIKCAPGFTVMEF